MNDKDICNLALSKLGSNLTIDNLHPPKSPVERHCARVYPQAVRSELTKYRWAFSRSFKILTQEVDAEFITADRPYAYALPEDFLRPIKWKTDDWQRRGALLYTGNSTFTLEYIAQVPETQFDPLFIDALACRMAMESTKFATDSNVTLQDMERWYDRAINLAARANAVELGPEDIETEEQDNDWDRARQGALGL